MRDFITMEWSNERCINFVEDYRNLACLWKVTDPDYKDRKKRRIAQQLLADKYELGTRQAVNNKIKSFRSYFHRLRSEARKKRGEIEVYEPSWFLYKYLLFILCVEENHSDKEVYTTSLQDTELEYSHDDQFVEIKEEPVEEQSNVLLEQTLDSSSPTAPSIKKAKYNDLIPEGCLNKSVKELKRFNWKQAKPVKQNLSLPGNVAENATKRDHLSAFGEYVESRIRNLKEPHLQAIAQMRINSILFEMEMDQTAPDMSYDQHYGSILYTSNHTNTSHYQSPEGNYNSTSTHDRIHNTLTPKRAGSNLSAETAFPSEQKSMESGKVTETGDLDFQLDSE